MQYPYRRDILDQPQALQDTLEALAGNIDLAAGLIQVAERLQTGGYRRIVLTGMGSSHFALIPLHIRLVQAGYPAWLVETSELLYEQSALIDADTLVIAASQSGASAEIVRLIKLMHTEVEVIGITNTPNSPLAQKAGHTVLTRAGLEATVSCKTYVVTLAAQAWLGDQLLTVLGSAGQFAQLEGAPAAAAEYLQHWSEYVNALQSELKMTKYFYLAGRGASMAAVRTGSLIMKESVKVPSEGMSVAAFRHGPLEMISPDSFVLVFTGTGDTQDLNRKLVREVVYGGGQAGLVERDHGNGVFNLPAAADAALALLEILPVQMMTLAIGEIKGIEAGQFRLATKITSDE